MEYNFIKIKNIKEKVLQISLNNPKARNAINTIMLDELINCLDDLSKKKKLEYLLLQEKAKHFLQEQI